MSTVVSTSTVTGSSGTTYLSGLSGLDTSALIEAAVEAKMAPAYRLDDQIETLETKSSAYSEMSTLLTTLSDALENLSSDAETSSFDARAAYLTSAALTTPTNHVSVTVSDEADLGVYSLKVEQLAQSHKVASVEQDTDTALGYDGVFTLQAEDGEDVSITVDADMTLADLADAINAESDTSGVVATVIATSTGKQTLVLSTATTGHSIVAATSSGDDVLQGLGITDSNGDFADELQVAQDAVFYIDDVKVTSDTNSIEDVLPGVSLILYAATGDNTLSLEVGQDLSTVLSDIEAFVEAYNAYRDFALTNQAYEAGTGASEEAVLFGDSILKGANTALAKVLNTTTEVDGTTYTLSDLGLSLDDDNKLVIDSTTLEEMLLQHPEVVESLFSSSTTWDSTEMNIVSAPAAMTTGTYTLEIDYDETSGSITSATLNGVALTVSGTTLSGSGTTYDGLYIAYWGKADASITIEIQTGAADAFRDVVDDYTNTSDGILTERISSLSDTIDSKQEKRDRVAEKAADYEDYLIAYYAKLEQSIAESDLQIQQIKALFYGTDDDD